MRGNPRRSGRGGSGSGAARVLGRDRLTKLRAYSKIEPPPDLFRPSTQVEIQPPRGNLVPPGMWSPAQTERFEMSSTIHTGKRFNSCGSTAYLAKALCERPGRTLQFAADSGGERALLALFEVVRDMGYRQVLVDALGAPGLPWWTRNKMAVFLFGNEVHCVEPMANLLQ